MSTYALFERHKELAKHHEESVQMWLEDSASVLRRPRSAGAPAEPSAAPGGAAELAPGGGDLGGAAAAAGVASKALRCALAQQRLAVRELREAARLRPRDEETRKRLATARQTLREMQAALTAPEPKPLRRFLAHYNLSIRYWDSGKARRAIEEARLACEELARAKLPMGCAEHNLVVMQQVHGAFQAEERRLQELERDTKWARVDKMQAVLASYDLGILYFDKRMLLRGEEQLKAARERARTASALRLVGFERKKQLLQEEAGGGSLRSQPVWLNFDDGKIRRMTSLLEDIEDDLDFLAGLRQHWCAEEETGKADNLQETGVRDGGRHSLLPCLKRRYSQECRECDEWWSAISGCTSIDLSATARRSPPARRGRAQSGPADGPAVAWA